MADILLIGCGQLGALVASDLGARHRIVGVRRNQLEHPAVTHMIQADITEPQTLDNLTRLSPEVILYCVAPKSRDDFAYEQTYVQGLKNVLQTQHHNRNLRRVFYVSSTRVFGKNTQEWLDESIEPVPDDFGGQRIREAECWLMDSDFPATILRLSGIYGKERPYLLNLAQMPQSWPKTNHWTNRIHEFDATAAITYLIERQLTGECVEDCYHITDGNPVPIFEVLLWLASRMGVEHREIKVPSISGGKKIISKRLASTGFTLQFPDYQTGYGSLL